MAEVTSLTAARMLEIEAASVVSGEINGSGHLILTTHDGTEIDAGYALVAVPNASDTQRGIVELATTSEVAAGTDTTRAVTPYSLKNGFVLPVASDTAKGIVELATTSETATGTDETRAVTPAGMAPTVSGINTRLSALEAQVGERVQLLGDNSKAETAAGTTYPLGVSLMSISSNFWPSITGYGTVTTFYYDNTRCYQEFHRHQVNESWVRTYNSQSGGWTSWTPIQGHIVTGVPRITPVANTPTSLTWSYGKTLPSPVRVVATVETTVIETTVRSFAVSDITTSNCKVWVYRTNTTGTDIQAIAIGGL